MFQNSIFEAYLTLFEKGKMSKTKGFIYASISAATYGLIPLFALPVMAKGVHFDSILCYRFLVASVALAGLMMVRKESFRISRCELFTLVGLGCLFASSAMFLFWSYQFMAAGIASTILFLYPVFVAILMATLFRERISLLTQVAIGIAMCGVVLLYGGDGDAKISLIGILIVLMSALTYAFYLIGIHKSNVQMMDGKKITFYAMLVAMSLFFMKAQFTGGLQALPDNAAILNIVLLGMIPTVVSCVTMVLSVHYIGSTNTAVFGVMEPLTAVAVGICVFSEPFTLNLALGIVLVIIAVILIILSDRVKKSLQYLLHIIIPHISEN